MTAIRRLAALFCLGLAVFLSAACSRSTPTPIEVVVTVPVAQTQVVEVVRQETVVVTATPEPTPAYESPLNTPADTLVYPLAADPATLDPQQASDEISQLVVQQLYEGLYNLRGDGSVVPAAATDLALAPDGTVYTVTLRSGLSWSDGSLLTAQHYVDGVCRVLDPEVGNPAYYLLTDVAPVVNARAYAIGDLADCAEVGIRAADDVTLVIALERPATFLPRLLAAPLFWPAPPSTVVTGTEPLAAAAELLTNGPYLLSERVANDHLTLTRNPNYWNAGEVSIGQIEFRILPDLAQQLARYAAGDLAVSGLPAADTPRIQADPAWASELQLLVQPGVSYLALNTQVAPTNDVNVRRAIASALDRQYLIDQVLKQPWHLPAEALIPRDVPGHQDAAGNYPYDPEAARRYLAEAGFGPEKPVPPVELWYNREGNNEALFKAVGSMLEAVGIPVRLLSSEWNVYLDALENCNKPARADAARSPGECTYQLYRMGWVMDYPDAASMLATFRPGSRFQYTGWESAEYDNLLNQALAEPDEAGRASLYSQAERVVLQEAVIVPLQYYDRTVLVKQGVTFDYPPFGPPNLQYWKMRPNG